MTFHQQTLTIENKLSLRKGIARK